jgi:hypothetical protein
MIVVHIDVFKEAYHKATGGSTDNVETAIIYYLDGDDYTVIPDGVRIVDMYNFLHVYLELGVNHGTRVQQPVC